MRKARLLTLAVFAVFVAQNSYSQNEDVGIDSAKRAAAERLFSSTDMEKMLTSSLDASVDMQMQQFAQMGISAEGMAKMKVELMAFFEEVMSWESLQEEFYTIYAEAFTTEELEAIADFYETPAGSKVLELTPVLMRDGMMIGQTRVQENEAKLQARLVPILEAEKAE